MHVPYLHLIHPPLRSGLVPTAVALFLITPPLLSAQQFVVDDAAIVDRGACQLEGWWGRTEAFLLPACQFLPAVELTLGVAHLDPGSGSRRIHLQPALKWMIRDPEGAGWGWGVAAGTLHPLQGSTGVSAAWAYLPLTASFGGGHLLHLNVGWGFEREEHGDHTHDHHGIAWGGRGDLAVLPRLTIIGEAFGLSGEGVEVQVGLRSELVPDRLHLDLSHGFHLEDRSERLGLQIGLAWTPQPLF